MRIVQLAVYYGRGDAIGNETMAIYELLRKLGYETGIYAINIHEDADPKVVHSIRELRNLTEEDIIIYHLAIGTDLNYKVTKYPGRKIVVFHNITPSVFFRPYTYMMAMMCDEGMRGLRFLSDKVDYCFADSQYNKNVLIQNGYHCPIDVLPIIMPFSDYAKVPDETVMNRYSGDGRTNILFTGRIAPNKKQEDVIASFYCYQKLYDPDARLFLVGNYNGMEAYQKRLMAYTEKLGVRNVVFTGHIRFSELLAYYHLADLFLCESEHEGFCVPLLEAMYLNIPIIAYDCTAVGETLGKGGFLVKEKNHSEIAASIHRVLTDEPLRSYLLSYQRQRLAEFAPEKTEAILTDRLNKLCCHGHLPEPQP